MALVFQHQFTCCVSGPTRSGKTVFVIKILENLDDMCDVKFDEIIWCHGIAQPLHAEIQKKINVPIKFHEGIPHLDEITTMNSGPKIVVIDDLMAETDENLANLFTRGSHHRNISIFNLGQNIFHQSKSHRTVSLNSHYFIIFKNPRDKMQIMSFARQVEPHNAKFIYEAYTDATARPHGYLVFDLKQETPEDMRYRTNIFPGESNIVYVPKKQTRK
jgi:hypothetical protein